MMQASTVDLKMKSMKMMMGMMGMSPFWFWLSFVSFLYCIQGVVGFTLSFNALHHHPALLSKKTSAFIHQDVLVRDSFSGGEKATTPITVSSSRSRALQSSSAVILEQIQKVTGEDTFGLRFGHTVAMDEDRAVITASYWNGNNGNVAAYIYDRLPNDTWSFSKKLTNPGSPANTNAFGLVVDIQGNFVAIGAPGEDVDQGAVFMYEYSGTSWGNPVKIVPNSRLPGGYFGHAVAISGDTLAVGAPGSHSGGAENVYIFTKSGTSWTEEYKIARTVLDPIVSLGGRFGYFIALEGDTLVAVANSAGAVYVFQRGTTDDSWSQTGHLVSVVNPGGNTGFGRSVAVSGNSVFVGELQGNGAVYMYEAETNSGLWNLVATITATDGDLDDKFGRSVAVSGDRLLVGADLDDDKGTNSGAAYLFERNSDGSWLQLAKFTADDEPVGSQMGWSVAMNGDVMLAGAFLDDSTVSDSGSAYFFGIPPPKVYFDFDIAVEDVTISLTNDTDFSEAIVFRYNYTGGTPAQDPQVVNFTYDIRQADCNTQFAPYGNTSMALYFNEFVEDVPNGQVTAKLGINLATIEEAQDVWFQDNRETQAVLKFCSVWNIYINDVLFQFHETNVTASINLKEDSGFTVDELSVDLDRINADALNEDIAVDFPIDVFFCHNNATRTDPPTDEFTQGDPVQVCLQLETATDNVFVQGVEAFNYSATQVNTSITLIDGGTLKYGATAEFDCSRVSGVCLFKFIPVATMFVDTADNDLFIEGLALIAFGGTDVGARRAMAFAARPSDGVRRMQEDGAKFAPFDFNVGNLQPQNSGQGSAGAEHGLLISVVVGCAVVVIVGIAVALFLYHRKRSMQAMVMHVKAHDLDKNETEEDVSSFHPPGKSQLETNTSDCYEIVEV